MHMIDDIHLHWGATLQREHQVMDVCDGHKEEKEHYIVNSALEGISVKYVNLKVVPMAFLKKKNL